MAWLAALGMSVGGALGLLGAHGRWRARRRLTIERLRRVESAGSTRRRELEELSDRIEVLGSRLTTEADHRGLQDLLDRYVDLAVAHARCLAAARRSTAARPVPAVRGDGDHRPGEGGQPNPRRPALAQACLRRAAALDGELDAIAELIRRADATRAATVSPGVTTAREETGRRRGPPPSRQELAGESHALRRRRG